MPRPGRNVTADVLVVVILTGMAFLFLAPLAWMVTTSLDESANTELPEPPRFVPWSRQNAASQQQSAKAEFELGAGAAAAGADVHALLRSEDADATQPVALQLDAGATATLKLDLAQRRFIRRVTFHAQSTAPAVNLALAVSPDRYKASQTQEVNRDTVPGNSVEIIAERGSRADDLFNLSEMTVTILDPASSFLPAFKLLGGPGGDRLTQPASHEDRQAGKSIVRVFRFEGPQLCKRVEVSVAGDDLARLVSEIRLLDDGRLFPETLITSAPLKLSQPAVDLAFPQEPKRLQHVFVQLASAGPAPARVEFRDLLAESVRQPSLTNYVNVLRVTDDARREFGPLGRFGRYYANSLLVACGVTLLGLLINSLLAFPLAHGTFPGREGIFVFVLATMMVPAQVTMIPIYRMMAGAELVNNPWSLILPGLVSAYGVFLLVQGMRAIPISLLESARIDGSSEWRSFWSIVLPLTKPVLATLGILTFLASWNSFIWPLIMINEERWKTLPLGLLTYQRQFTAQWGNMMAAATVSIVPVIITFILMQKQVIRGITMGGVKG